MGRRRTVQALGEPTSIVTTDDILAGVTAGVSAVGVTADRRLAGGTIPVTVDGTRVYALFVGTVRAW